MTAMMAGALNGLIVLVAGQATSDDTSTGILTFAVGMIVGLTCVVALDYYVRYRLDRDYTEWLAAGKPERRARERRKRGRSERT